MADDITSSILGNFEKEASDIRRGAPARDVFNTEAIISQFTDRTQPREPLPSMPEPTTELRQGKPEDEAWYQEVWRRITQNPDEIRARAANAMAISKEYNVSPSEAYERHDEFARESGLMGQPANKEFIDKLMTGAVVSGLLTHPLATVLGVSGFAALSEAESYAISKLQGKKYRFGEQKGVADLVPDVSRDAETFLDIIDFVAKGIVVGGGMKVGKEWGVKADAMIKEKFLRDTFEEYKMPEKVFISAEKMKEFFGTGERITPEEYDLIQSLGLDAAGYRDAIKYGVDIEIPAERLVRVVDKPWWGKLKETIGLNPYEEIRVEGGGGPKGKRPVSGLIEEGNVAEETMRPFADILKDIKDAFGETGAVAFTEGGLRNLTPEQIAARERLKRDFEVAKKKASEAGEDIATFLKKMGIDEKIATYMIGEFGGEAKGEEKDKQFINILVEGKPGRVEVVSDDPLFEVDRTISEMAATPYELTGESPSYEQIRQKAAQQALEKYEKRVDIRKKREAAMVRRHAEGAVQENPLWALMNEVVKGGGLNLEALRRDYDKDTVKELMRRRPGLVTKEGKYYLDTLAAENDLPSGDALMNQLIDLPLKEEMVQKEIRTFEEAFGDELEADYSDLYVKMIDEEAKLMAKLTEGYKPRPSPGIKKVIREQTGQVLVGDLVGEYDALKAGMKKAEQASRKAWAAGNKEGAITEKLRQKEIAIKLREKTAAKQEAKKIKDGLIKLLKTPVGKDALPPEYMDQLQELLGGYDLMPRGPKTARRIENLKDMLARHEETGELGAIIANSLIDRVSKVHWKELTLDELRDLHDAAEMIVHLGKLKNKLIAGKEKRDLRTAVDTVVNTIRTNYPQAVGAPLAEPLLREEKSLTGRLGDNLRAYRAELIKPEYIFRRLDKFEDLGPVWSEVFLPFNRAESAEYARGAELTKRLLDAMDPFTKGFRGGAKWAHEKVKIPGVRKILTKEQMIMVALNTGNEGNMNALLKGNKFTEDEVNRILAALKPEEMGLVRTVWDIIDSMYGDLAGVYRQLTGTLLRKVDGNYFPLMFDRELSWRADAFQAEAEARDFFKTIYTKPSVEKGFTKERKGGKLPVRLDFGVIFKHINDVNHYITHALAVRDVQRIISNHEVRAIITDRLGKEYYDELMPWLQEIAKPRQEPISKTEKILERIRANSTIVAMGLKITTALQQPLSLSQSVEELGIVPVMESVSKFYASIPTTVSFVNARSEMMANRLQHFDREVEALGRKIDPAIDAGVRQTYFLMMGLIDVASAYPTWTAAYKIGMERFGSDQKAIDYADMIVRKTQSTAAPKDLAAIQRGGSLKKLLTMFYTFFSSMQNQMMERGAQFKAGDKGIFDHIKAWWWIIIFPAVMSQVIRDRGFSSPGKTAKDVLAYRFGGLPVVRDVASGALTDFDYQFSPIGSAGKEFSFTGRELLRPAEGKRIREEKMARHGLQVIGYAFGIPTGQFLVTADGAIDLAAGRTKDPTVLLMREQKRK